MYVYDDAVHHCVDYDVPTARHVVQRTPGNVPVSAAVAVDCVSSQDYDIPPGASPSSSSSCRYNDDDVDFGVGDYDLLSPPQRPASDVDCSLSSNRSSVTSVVSGGSLSSGCASVRSPSAQSPSAYVGRSAATAGARINGFGPHFGDQSVPRLYVSEETSDSSADSGIVLQTLSNSPVKSNVTSTLNGVSCRRNDTADDTDCLDYDVPLASINGTEGLGVVEERRTATPQHQCPSSAKYTSPVNGEELGRCNVDRCANDDRRRRVEELRDCVMRNVQRFLAWTGRATGDAASTDAATARQCYGQAKLAGLAVRTSLKELVALVDGNPPELLRHIDTLNKLLSEIDRRLNRLIESGSEGPPRRLVGSCTGGRRAARESTACRDRLQAVAEIVVNLPEPVKQFADFVASTSAVVVRPPDDLDMVQSPPPTGLTKKILSPSPMQRKDSLQRDKPPQSPSAVAGGVLRGGRPPLGKPPPVKPKPPKTVTWKRPPHAPAQPRPTGSPGTTTVNGTASRQNSTKQDRRVTELNKKNGPSMDDWNEDDCDYVSIVREVEREMESAIRPVTKNPTTLGNNPLSSAPLNDDDRELLAFYAAQISAHVADVDAATAEFYRCCPSSSSSPSVDAFVRRSRFVVLAAHRLVYVGDVIARHVTNQSVRDRVAAAANALCLRLKAVVMATRDAAIATADDEDPVAVAGVRQTMMDSVRYATDDCRRLCDVISAVSF